MSSGYLLVVLTFASGLACAHSSKPCDDAIWRHTAAGRSIAETLLSWSGSCGDKVRCKKLSRDPSWLLGCAREALLGMDTTRWWPGLRLFKHAVEVSSSKAIEEPPVLRERVTCLRPINATQRGTHFNEDLLSLQLEPGRVCSHCPEKCELLVFADVLPEGDVKGLVVHADTVSLNKQKKRALRGGVFDGQDTVNILDSRSHGTLEGHILFLYALEVGRRLSARVSGFPVSSLKFQTHFLALADSSSGHIKSPSVHCDQAHVQAYHQSGVLLLTGHDLEHGGGLEFFDGTHAHKKVRRTLPAVPGRLVLFSSGWENIHHVAPLLHGRRWSMPFFVSFQEADPSAESINITDLVKSCLWRENIDQQPSCEMALAQFMSVDDDDRVEL